MRDESSVLKREVQVTGLVAFAHLLSHFYMLALPPLFPMARADLGLGYGELGMTITAFAITTGLLQTPMGFLVNKIGGRKVLIGGLLLNAAAIALVGLVTSFWQLIALMLLAGVGSSVFHPADYSILTARIDNKRLGRALATHTVGGNLGFVFAPPLMVALAAMFDWRVAMMTMGLVGVALALVMLVLSGVIGDGGMAKRKDADSWRKLVTSPKIMMLFAFYVLSSGANCGIVYFSVVALKDIYDLPVAATAAALTAYQVLSLLAVLPGGWLADRVENHELLLAICLGLSSILVVIGGLGFAPFWLAASAIGAAGALRGLVNTSRDVSVRHAATEVSVGTLFGFVTTGYSGGQIIGPAVYGWLMDLGHPQLVFWASAAFSALAICTMLTGRALQTRTAFAGE
jgi:FSR family fosmidomycin resistance protein-like MFS transporter